MRLLAFGQQQKQPVTKPQAFSRLVTAHPKDFLSLGKSARALASDTPDKTPDETVHWLDKRLTALFKGLGNELDINMRPTASQQDGYTHNTPARHWQTLWVNKKTTPKHPEMDKTDAKNQTQEKASVKHAGVITHSVVEDNGRKKQFIVLAKPFKPNQFGAVAKGLAHLMAHTATQTDIQDVIVLAGPGDTGLRQWMTTLSQQKGMHDHQFGAKAINGVPDKWRHLVNTFDPAENSTMYMFHANALLKPFDGLTLSADEKRQAIEKTLSGLR